jgi:hypothetical protein
MVPHSRRPALARQLSFGGVLASMLALTPACSDDAPSRSTCEAVERARCAFPQCFAVGSAFGAAEDCAGYAVDVCRGGTVAGVVASADDQRACTTAIRTAGDAGDCASLRNPGSLRACAFLVPAGVDAGRD